LSQEENPISNKPEVSFEEKLLATVLEDFNPSVIVFSPDGKQVAFSACAKEE
jgi:Tol biopolymer transport system component